MKNEIGTKILLCLLILSGGFVLVSDGENQEKEDGEEKNKQLKVLRNQDGSVSLISPSGVIVTMVLIDDKTHLLVQKQKSQLAISEYSAKEPKSGFNYTMSYPIDNGITRKLIDINGDLEPDLLQEIIGQDLLSQHMLELVKKPHKKN